MAVVIEKIGEFTSALGSPLEDDGVLYVVSSNGDIMIYQGGQFKVEFKFGGQPSSIAIDKDNNLIYIADMAHQAIMVKQIEEKNSDSGDIINQNDQGLPFLGPNSIIISLNLNVLFFSDSGPFGETSNENCKGSVYMYDLDNQQVKPLALNCLAYPSGLVMGLDEKSLFVCETCKNRVIRFILTNQGGCFFSVLYQFQGKFGPTAISVSNSDLLYVGRFEFSQVSSEGAISVLNMQGQLVDNILLPGYPEISGMYFSQFKSNVLFITENSTQSCLKIIIQQDDGDPKKKEKDSNQASYKTLIK